MLPNLRMKLTARGGDGGRKEFTLSVAAAGCSLCTFR